MADLTKLPDSNVVIQKADEEIINNLELLLNLEALEESDIWDDLAELVTSDVKDEEALPPESEKKQ